MSASSALKVLGQDNVHLELCVNGERRQVSFAPYKTLLEVLREEMRLTGTKHGCELGECGACAVLIDGEPTLSCLTLGLECEDRQILTVEGTAHGRQAAPAARGLRRSRRRPVRVLHTRHPRHGQGAV